MSRRTQSQRQPFLVGAVALLWISSSASAYVVPNRPMAFVGLTGAANSQNNNNQHSISSNNQKSAQYMSAADGSLGAAEDAANIPVTTFREAEVLGLRYMQEGNYEQALTGTKCWLKL